MIAAVYARKSTEQTGVADEQRSVARQVEHAHQYAARKGWTIANEHVYVDDAVSGAEFEKRPGFQRLLNALKPRPSFDVLVMSEESRLGREAIETSHALKQIVTAGVRVFVYLEDREIQLGTMAANTMAFLRAEFAAEERRKASQRVTDKLSRNARAGYVTGGFCFGYRNHDVVGADGRRSHVERQIDAEEAAVVRDIFQRCAAGQGFRGIAKALNETGAAAPRPRRGRPRGWAPSSIREVLYRELYRGVIVYNRTRKRDQWGQVNRQDRPPAEWIRVDAPQLRIVSDEIWSAAHERLRGTRQVYLKVTGGKTFGRPLHGLESPHLLAGFACCALCGGTMTVRSRHHAIKRRTASFYVCSSYHLRGRAVCPNSLAMRQGDADEAILTAMESQLLIPDVIDEAMTRAIEQATRGSGEGDVRRRQIRETLARLDQELERLTAAILVGGEASTLVAAMREREQQREALRRELKALERPRQSGADPAALRQQLRSRLGEWRSMLRGHMPQSRQMIRKLMEDRIVFTPDRDSRIYRYRIPGSLGRIFKGIVDPKLMVDAGGIEPPTS